MSAWIETGMVSGKRLHLGVALLVSAWIETKQLLLHIEANSCRTPRECVD